MKLPSHLTKNASSEAHASLIQTSASQVVDLNEIANDEEISFQNTSGLAYSVSDLEKWAQDFDTSSGNPIVICHQASSAGESLFPALLLCSGFSGKN